MDTFDPKPNHENGGPTRAIQTSVPGIRIAEHLPRVARQMQDIALVRAMASREADHGRATYQMRTGHLPSGEIQYPTLGSLFSKELEQPGRELPNFVSIAPYPFFSPAAYSPGFLGPQYAAMVLAGDQQGLLPIPGSSPTTKARCACRTSTCRPASLASAPRPASTCWKRWSATSTRTAPRFCPRATATPTTAR